MRLPCGAATSVEEAIQLHDGDALEVQQNFELLSDEQKTNVIRFVESL